MLTKQSKFEYGLKENIRSLSLAPCSGKLETLDKIGAQIDLNVCNLASAVEPKNCSVHPMLMDFL